MKCVLDLEEKVFQVTVKDTGVGIENVEKAMEPMFTTCPELERCCGERFCRWVDLCRGWQEA